MVSNQTITIAAGITILTATLIIPIITKQADAVKVFITTAIGLILISIGFMSKVDI